MSTYTQLLYQIVFSTKHRRPTLVKPVRADLFAYIHGVLNHKSCHAYQIGGVADHLHIVTHIHPSVAIAELVKDLKLSSGQWLRKDERCPDFSRWQEGYAVFTYAIESKQNLVRYVLRQEEHHREQTFVGELKGLLKEHDVDFDERFLV